MQTTPLKAETLKEVNRKSFHDGILFAVSVLEAEHERNKHLNNYAAFYAKLIIKLSLQRSTQCK